ncbi:hypothetical protein ACJX0J_024721 [Zea mays]
MQLIKNAAAHHNNNAFHPSNLLTRFHPVLFWVHLSIWWHRLPVQGQIDRVELIQNCAPYMLYTVLNFPFGMHAFVVFIMPHHQCFQIKATWASAGHEEDALIGGGHDESGY